MTNCIKCGAQIEENLKYCSSCGAPVEAPAQQKSEPIDISDKLSQLNNTPDSTAEFDAQDIEKNKIMAVLAYVIFLIPLFAAKDSKFARFHTNQGIVLVIASIIASVIAAIPVIGWVIAPIVAIIVTVLAIMGILNALGGKAKELPIVGKYKILK